MTTAICGQCQSDSAVVVDNGDVSTDGVTSRRAKCSRYAVRTLLHVRTHQFTAAEGIFRSTKCLGTLLVPYFLYLCAALRDGRDERERAVE